MKAKNIILATALVALGLTSCSINDVDNVGELAAGNFPVKQDDGVAALAGVYENLNAVNANPQESFLYYACLASDDQLGGGGTNDKLMQAEDLLCNYNADMTNDFYKQRYEGINRANTLIQSLPGTAMSDELKTQYLGEAKFLRAFYYYELSSMYGNVPLRTEPGGEPIKQGKIEDVWKQILQDLYEAATTMPAKRNNDGHVDKYTAEGMLARAWLFYTGFFCNGTTIADEVSSTYKPLTEVELPNGTKLTKQMVIDLIDDCVNNSGYSLVSDFRNLWAYTNKETVNDYDYTKGQDLKWVEDDGAVNPESMFAIKFNKLASWNTTIGYSNGYALHFGVRGGQDYAKTFPFGQGWGAGPVAPNLVKDWTSAEPNDKRLDATVQDWHKVSTYTWGGWSDYVQETGYYDKKWSPISAKKEDGSYICCFEDLMYGDKGGLSGGYGNNMQLDNIHDLVLLRFADVLLMQSELKEDVAGINKVRARAGLSPIASYSLKALQNERRWELACEGIRWNDIRRWHIAADVLERQTNEDVFYCGTPGKNKPQNGGYAARYKATAGFQKMPESEIAIGTVVQNEGWTGADSEYQGWQN
ncbi:MAG: RagB/SusD family nutrient uptake outer membrane protein [Prevotella sp.]|nr:RagB/SusD family nutrient uptake outer membrane protein [Prevotella sp.]